jgi:protoporphyrinogen oxidase
MEAAGVEFRLGERLTLLSSQGGRFLVRTEGGEYRSDRLISTIPLERTMALAGVREAAPRSSTLTTLCCRFQGEPGFQGTVLYNFHRDGAWKRLTMHSDYYGEADGWRYFSVEATSRADPPSPSALFDDFRAMASSVGLFDGALELVDAFETGFAYPIYDLDAERQRAEGRAALAALGVETVGRQGSFDYLPSSAQAIGLALAGLSEGRTAA